MQQNAEKDPPALLPQALPLPVWQVPMIYNRRPKIIYTKYNQFWLHAMSLTLIVLGIVCFVNQFVDFFFFSDVTYVGAGIWGGSFFILTGSVGLVSSIKRTKATIVTFMVLCTIGSVLAVFPLGLGAAGLGLGIEKSDGIYCKYNSDYCFVSVIVNGFMMVASFISFILMIVLSAYTCKDVCPDCCRENPGMLMAGQVKYMAGPNGDTQVLIMPVNQTMSTSNFASSTANPSGYINPGQPTDSAPVGMVKPPAYQEMASLPENEAKY